MPPPSLREQQFQDHMKAIEQTHSQTKATYSKLTTADTTLGKVRSQLEDLASLGDMVTQDDVVKAAGSLVAHGLGPMAMAGMLVDMPPDGQALQGWVGQHLKGLEQREAQLEQAKTQVRYQLGQSALHLLTAHHVGLGQGVPETPAKSNALTVPPPQGASQNQPMAGGNALGAPNAGT